MGSTSQLASLVVGPRFAGPPGMGNGGYVAGRVAAYVPHEVVEVTLRRPFPLDAPVSIVRDGADGVDAVAGGEVVAEARPGSFTTEVPGFVGEATGLAEGLPDGNPGNPFRGCFVCGPDRAVGDGLRLFVGPTGVAGVLAARTRVPLDLLDGGTVPFPILWSALDCPTAFAAKQPFAPAVLGRITATVHRTSLSRELVVAAWPLGSEGRKHYAGAVVTDRAGTVLGRSEAVWIDLRT